MKEEIIKLELGQKIDISNAAIRSVCMEFDEDHHLRGVLISGTFNINPKERYKNDKEYDEALVSRKYKWEGNIGEKLYFWGKMPRLNEVFTCNCELIKNAVHVGLLMTKKAKFMTLEAVKGCDKDGNLTDKDVLWLNFTEE